MAMSNAVLKAETNRSEMQRDRSASEPEGVREGAFLFVLARDREREIFAAIRAAYGSDISLHPASVRARLRPSAPSERWSVPPEGLTRREIDVLRLLARGNTNRQTAGVLGLSVRTVENHRANLLAKLGAASRAEIVSYAAEYDLV